ncbi:MAG: hypothetical protein RBR71_11010 [Gudongella sp.]|nr:hypothetical protein [Gudongella sp.]
MKKKIKMNNITKVGVVMYISVFLIEIILGYLLKIKPPIILRYMFYGGLGLSLVGILIQGSKNRKLK